MRFRIAALTCLLAAVLASPAAAIGPEDDVSNVLDDYIARQPSLVTKKRQVVPVVLQRMQIAESLARHLDRLGLERKAKDVDVAAALAALDRGPVR